jgi:hypothetical protein
MVKFFSEAIFHYRAVVELTKIVFTRSPSDCVPAVQQTLADAIKFSGDVGFQSVVYRLSLKDIPGYYLKLISSWIFADVLVAVYPSFYRFAVSNDHPLRAWDDFLFRILNTLKPKNKRILFLYDLPIEQGFGESRGQFYDSKSYELESRILRSFDILCVFNRNMREIVRDRYNLAEEKFVELELPDYGIKPKRKRHRIAHNRGWNVFYIGNGDRHYDGEWMSRLKKVDYVRYEFLGLNWDWIEHLGRDDFTRHGLYTQQELCDYMHANADFGIIAYADRMSDYCKYACPSKFGAYVTAGVPILVKANCQYVASLVKRYGIGLPFHSVDQIPALTKALSESRYEKMRDACQCLSEKLSNGYYFKRALAESLQVLGSPQGSP